jgi:hypothetical protein
MPALVRRWGSGIEGAPDAAREARAATTGALIGTTAKTHMGKFDRRKSKKMRRRERQQEKKDREHRVAEATRAERSTTGKKPRKKGE